MLEYIINDNINTFLLIFPVIPICIELYARETNTALWLFKWLLHILWPKIVYVVSSMDMNEY